MKRRDVLKWAAAGLTVGALSQSAYADRATRSDKGLKEITLEVTGMT